MRRCLAGLACCIYTLKKCIPERDIYFIASCKEEPGGCLRLFSTNHSQVAVESKKRLVQNRRPPDPLLLLVQLFKSLPEEDLDLPNRQNVQGDTNNNIYYYRGACQGNFYIHRKFSLSRFRPGSTVAHWCMETDKHRLQVRDTLPHIYKGKCCPSRQTEYSTLLYQMQIS